MDACTTSCAMPVFPWWLARHCNRVAPPSCFLVSCLHACHCICTVVHGSCFFSNHGQAAVHLAGKHPKATGQICEGTFGSGIPAEQEIGWHAGWHWPYSRWYLEECTAAPSHRWLIALPHAGVVLPADHIQHGVCYLHTLQLGLGGTVHEIPIADLEPGPAPAGLPTALEAAQ